MSIKREQEKVRKLVIAIIALSVILAVAGFGFGVHFVNEILDIIAKVVE